MAEEEGKKVIMLEEKGDWAWEKLKVEGEGGTVEEFGVGPPSHGLPMRFQGEVDAAELGMWRGGGLLRDMGEAFCAVADAVEVVLDAVIVGG